jgi:hypothetical protein
MKTLTRTKTQPLNGYNATAKLIFGLTTSRNTENTMRRRKLSDVQQMRTNADNAPQTVGSFNLERDTQKRVHERKIGNAASVRPFKHIPIGWPTDGHRPPWED